MPNPENLIGQGFHTNPERINRNGRPKGKSLATIARKLLELQANLTEKEKQVFLDKYPALKDKKIRNAHLAVISVLNKTISRGDERKLLVLNNIAYPDNKNQDEKSVSINIQLGNDNLERARTNDKVQ